MRKCLPQKHLNKFGNFLNYFAKYLNNLILLFMLVIIFIEQFVLRIRVTKLFVSYLENHNTNLIYQLT